MTHLRKPEIKIKAQWRHAHTHLAYSHRLRAIIKRQMLKAGQINVKSERTLPKPHMTIFGGLKNQIEIQKKGQSRIGIVTHGDGGVRECECVCVGGLTHTEIETDGDRDRHTRTLSWAAQVILIENCQQLWPQLQNAARCCCCPKHF